MSQSKDEQSKPSSTADLEATTKDAAEPESQQEQAEDSSHGENPSNTPPTEPSTITTDFATEEDSLAEVAQTPVKSSGNGLKWLLVFLLLIALGISGWVGYQQWMQSQTVSEQLSSQDATINQQNAIIEQLQGLLNQQRQELIKLSQQQSANDDQQSLLRQQLAVTQEKLRLLSSKGRQEWVLEQAHYYLTLAQQKLLFENNVTTAMALLAEADATLANSGDLNLTELRQAIKNDLAALAAMPQHDTSSLLLTLNALQKQVAELQPQAIQLPETINEPEVDNKAWFDRLMQTLDKFGEDAFKFRTHDNKVQPLLSDEHKAVLQATLQLALTQAQTAAMEGNQSYYQTRLQFADELLQNYFQLNDQGAALSAQLKTLQQATVEAPATYQLTALPMMDEFKQQRRLQWYSEQSIPAVPETEGDEQ